MQTDAETGAAPAYYMINCAHPTHFETRSMPASPGSSGCAALRANASTRSHAELEARHRSRRRRSGGARPQYADLRRRFRHFNVLGGCCGTDHRHVEQICFACEPAA